MKEILEKIKGFFVSNNESIIEQKECVTLEPDKKENVHILEMEDVTKIEVLEPCNFVEFECPIEIPIRLFLKEGYNLLTTNILRQAIYSYEENEYDYYISQNEEQLLLSERKIENENILEIYLEIDKNKKTYRVTKYIHDKNYSTKGHQTYPMNEDSVYDFWRMDKKMAIVLLQGLVNRLDKSDKIGRMINFGEFCACVHLMPDLDYNPVIRNEKITLSINRFDKEVAFNKNNIEFTIFLNETREKIGTIQYFYSKEDGFTYDGNVCYEILEPFQHQGYATLALELLKNLLLKEQVKGDKDLYISTLPNNLYSQKVALNNQGELFYHGPVPQEDKLYSQDGIEEVFVYRIKMDK